MNRVLRITETSWVSSFSWGMTEPYFKEDIEDPSFEKGLNLMPAKTFQSSNFLNFSCGVDKLKSSSYRN